MLGGVPHKRVLVLAFWGGGPTQVNHSICASVLCRLHPPLPSLCSWVVLTSNPYFANFYGYVGFT